MVGEPATRDLALVADRWSPRQRLPELGAEVDAHLHVRGPWKDQRSALDDEPAVTAAVETIARDAHAKIAA